MGRKKQVLTVQKKQEDIARRIAAVEALDLTTCPKCGFAWHRGWDTRPYFRCRCCKHRWSINPLVEALGRFLETLHATYPWDWFATLTFARSEISPAGAHYWFRRFLEELGDTGIAKPYAFRADEYGPLHGRFHLHALVGNVSHLRIYCGERLPANQWGRKCCWVHRWPCGYARIYPYDPALGAHYYLSKYVTKALADWDLIGFGMETLKFSTPQSSWAKLRTHQEHHR